MPRIKSINKEEASAELKQVYETLEKKMGKVINIFQGMGNSLETLKGFLSLSEQANHTSIPPKLRELIALVVGQSNNCQYCLSAHTSVAKGLGIGESDILKARQGDSQNPKENAILKFVKQIIDKKAHLSDADVSELKKAGVSDKEIVEIILLTVVNIFTNYFNLITDTKVDFPLAPDLNL